MIAGRPRAAWIVWAVGTAAFLSSIALSALNHHLFAWTEASQALAFFSIGIVGLVLARRRPQNPVGWLYLAVWLGVGVAFALCQEYARWATVTHPGAVGGTAAMWLTNWAWVPIFGVMLTFPFLLFPDGHLPSPRWRWVSWASGLVLVLWSVAFAFEGADFTDALNHHVANPYAIAGLTGFFNVAREVLAVAFIGLTGASVASLVVRFRRSRGVERQQIKWLMLSGAVLVVWLSLPLDHGSGTWSDTVQGFVIALVPISVGIAILRYRLFDVDVVINKTLVYGALAVFITAVYVAIVVGLGAVVGTHQGSLPLSILATGLVAVAFQPVRARMQRVANRLVYGERATPYDVLARFSDRVASTYATEDVLPRTARVIAEGTGAEAVEIWLRLGGELRPAASWPVEGASTASIPMRNGELPDLDADRALPVRHRDELLGAVTIRKPRGESLTPAEDRLLDDLTRQAGLVLANVRLTADLEARLDQISRQAGELRASRQRIVAAQDEERRRLERNIHDGAQQHLVALAVKLRLAKGFLGKDPERTRAMLEELDEEVGEALDTLTALSLGIYPPLLEEQGLSAALASQYQRSDLPVRMEVAGTRRYPIEVEAAVYFCVLEALQNAAKYAGASRIDVEIEEHDGGLSFEVRDDGAGFDENLVARGSGLQNMHDRLSTLGGKLQVLASPGGGASVAGWVPIFEPAEALR